MIVLLWALVHGGLALVLLALGVPAFALGTRAAPVWLNGVPVAAAGLALAAVAPGRPRRGRSRRLVGTAAVLAALSAFGLLMDVVTLAFNQHLDRGWPAVNHALGFIGLCALGRWLRGPCPGAARTDERIQRRAVVAAWVGAATLVPYVAMKATWASGGTFAGVTGAEMLVAAERNGASDLWLALERRGVDATILMAALGGLLLLAMLRPWGRRLPRWLLLVPAGVGAGTLVPYGVIGLGYTAAATAGWVAFPRGDFPTVADALLVSWIGLTAFAAFGVALALATHAHWSRTTPSCG